VALLHEDFYAKISKEIVDLQFENIQDLIKMQLLKAHQFIHDHVNV